jgi:hypothetical protein
MKKKGIKVSIKSKFRRPSYNKATKKAEDKNTQDAFVNVT